MWWEQGLDDQTHHDRIGIACVVDVLDGYEVVNTDEHKNFLDAKDMRF